MIHIHNGDVVATLAQRAGIPGEHAVYRESLISGPILPGEQWIESRAQALSSGEDLLRTRTSVLEQEQFLDAVSAKAAAGKGEIVLWFEHDLYCLIHLIYLLQRLGDAHLTLVWCPKPLNENDDRELHLLFESRTAVTPAMLNVAREVWRAYTSSDPRELNRFFVRDTPDFPFLREGLALHASRFPSTTNGLGTIEQRLLTFVATGATEFSALFGVFSNDLPRLGFGDDEIVATLQRMAWAAVPLVTLTGEPPKMIVTVTPAGENVLRGEVDDVRINDPDRWLGGVHLTKENLWRYDEAARQIVPSR
ncbi:MAG TPA: hypothetical protein VEU30_05865 [Thermoanaerobaculia bacterium]|nr:hypothetical protein [Thermoanaerobaculia bacterium]